MKWVRSGLARAALTSCFVLAAGDVSCQVIQQRHRKQFAIDWARTSRFGLVGLTLHGPFFYFGFKTIDAVCGPGRGIFQVLKKTAFGQVTFFPIYVPSFFTYVGVLEGRKLMEAVHRAGELFWPTFVAGGAFWPAANIVNFATVPPRFRVLYVGVVGLVWNAYLSWANSGGLNT